MVRGEEPTIVPHVLRIPFVSSTGFHVALAVFLTVVATSAGAQTQLTLEVRDDFVQVANTTPGGTVILATCARVSRNGRTHMARTATALRDDDGNGIVQYAPGSLIPLRSVWVAVDLVSGATAAAAPPDFPLSVTEIPSVSFKRNAESAADLLDSDGRRLFMLLVRPGSGAWTLFARDGAGGDEDRSENARLSMQFMDARSVEGRTAAPKQLKEGDVVVVIDPGHLDVSIARIQK